MERSCRTARNSGSAQKSRCASSIRHAAGYVGLRTFDDCSHSAVDGKMRRFRLGPKFKMVLKAQEDHSGAEMLSLGQGVGDAAVIRTLEVAICATSEICRLQSIVPARSWDMPRTLHMWYARRRRGSAIWVCSSVGHYRDRLTSGLRRGDAGRQGRGCLSCGN